MNLSVSRSQIGLLLMLNFVYFLLAKLHELPRKSVGAEAIIVPTTYTVSNAKASFSNKKCVFAGMSFAL